MTKPAKIDVKTFAMHTTSVLLRATMRTIGSLRRRAHRLLPECTLVEFVVTRQSNQTAVGNRQDEKDLIGSIVPDTSVSQSTEIRFHVEVDPSGHAGQRPATYAKNQKDHVRKERCEIDDLDDQRKASEHRASNQVR